MDTDATDGRATERAPDVSDLFDELEALRAAVDTPAERERVEETMDVAADLGETAASRRIIWGFDRGDAMEALLGAVIFGIPMFVEGGTLEIGVFLSDHPLALLVTLGAAGTVVHGILYVSEFRDVRVRDRLLGIVPRRLAGVLAIALAAAVVAMTAWGRVIWAEPVVAIAQCAVAFVPMAIGAALGDILPGT